MSIAQLLGNCDRTKDMTLMYNDFVVEVFACIALHSSRYTLVAQTTGSVGWDLCIALDLESCRFFTTLHVPFMVFKARDIHILDAILLLIIWSSV